MSVQARIIQQKSLSDSLRELMEVVNNPETIKKAHTSLRDEIALTEEENRKADEGRKFLKEYNALKDKLAIETKDLESQKAAHLVTIAAFQLESEKGRDRLYAMEEILALKSKELLENIQTHKDNQNDFLAECKNTEKSHSAVKNSLDLRESKLNIREEKLEKDKTTLAEQEIKLREKTNKFKALMD